jgi:hypothetical protein
MKAAGLASDIIAYLFVRTVQILIMDDRTAALRAMRVAK